MKYLFLSILSIVLFSCNNKISKPIVDYSTNYEDNRRMLNLSSAIDNYNKKQNDETIVLINDKKYTFDKFMKLVKKDKIRVNRITRDRAEIQELNYPENIKTVIVATRK